MPALAARLLLALCLALALAACDRPDRQAAPAEAAEVRAYAVPPGQTEMLAEALNEVMAGGEGAAAIGHASPRIPGQLLVRAPTDVHASVARTLEELTRTPPATGELARTLRIWRVDVGPGPDQGLARMAGQEAALDALRERFPGQGMVLADEISLAVSPTLGRSEISSGGGSVVSVEALPGEQPTFDVYYAQSYEGPDDSPAKFQSQMVLPEGETLVAATLNRKGPGAEGASVLLIRLEAAKP